MYFLYFAFSPLSITIYISQAKCTLLNITIELEVPNMSVIDVIYKRMYTNTLTLYLGKELFLIFSCPVFIYIKKFIFT